MNYGIEVLKEIMKIRNPTKKIGGAEPVVAEKKHYDRSKSPTYKPHYNRPYDYYHHHTNNDKQRYHTRKINKYDE